jgi:hypothetical protein
MKQNRKRKWTKREDRLIMRNRGPDAELAVSIDRTVSAIYQRRSVLRAMNGVAA